MSHNKIRESKSCLNCGAFVEKNYCPVCGQENSESRRSFHHLFTHFASDLVHYDSSFWKTIRSLLFSPAKLSIAYMEGKRKTYVEPVQLYIFISFVAFILPALLPDISLTNNKNENSSDVKTEIAEPKVQESEDNSRSKKNVININIGEPSNNGDEGFRVYNSLSQLDSAEQLLPVEKQMSGIKYEISKTITKVKEEERLKGRSIQEKIGEMLVHNLPKALFVYMPMFALLMWLFHCRRKKYFFDSGIFTLHLFSFILLLITIGALIDWLFNLVGIEWMGAMLFLPGVLYSIFYFFRANRLFYKENRTISNIKAVLLFCLNSILLIVFTIAYLMVIVLLSVYF